MRAQPPGHVAHETHSLSIDASCGHVRASGWASEARGLRVMVEGEEGMESGTSQKRENIKVFFKSETIFYKPASLLSFVS